jgi:hypothetical protein
MPVLRLHHGILGAEERNGAEINRGTGSDAPGSEDARNKWLYSFEELKQKKITTVC